MLKRAKMNAFICLDKQVSVFELVFWRQKT